MMKNRMRLRYGLLLLVTSILLMLQPRINAAQPTLEAEIDRFISHQMTTQHIPGLALAITHENHVLHVKGYGKANALAVNLLTSICDRTFSHHSRCRRPFTPQR